MSPWSEAIGAKTFKGLQRCSPFLHIIHANLPPISFIYILRGLTSGVLYIYPMSLFSRIFSLLVFLAAFAEAVEVQVIEGDRHGPRDLSTKKLKAMTTVYLAELGYVPSPYVKKVGVSFSSSNPMMHLIRMKKFLADGQIETDSSVVAEVDDVDNAVETMLKMSFGKAPKIYKGEKPSEVFFMDPVIVDVEDRKVNLATQRAESALGVLGYKLSENSNKVNVQLFLIKLKDYYWAGMVRLHGSKVVKGVHKKFSQDENLQSVVYSLTCLVMNQDVEPDSPNTEVVDYSNTHEASCRATQSMAESGAPVGEVVAGLVFDLLCYLSDYGGIEVGAGGKDLYGKWYPNLRFALVWGFSDYHSWLWELDYAGTMGQTQSRWAFESVHRFSQRKGLFVDIVWGGAYDRSYKGWFLGGDIGYNLLASSSKSHWLSLMLRYDWTLGKSFSNSGRVSVNLVYDLRGYYSD
jgi:hypothetical protein